jgi:hypothetical protein
MMSELDIGCYRIGSIKSSALLEVFTSLRHYLPVIVIFEFDDKVRNYKIKREIQNLKLFRHPHIIKL